MKPIRWTYPFTVTPDDSDESGGYVVQSRDLPEAISQGDDLSEALEAAEGALQVAIEDRLARSEPVPDPSKAKVNEYMVPLPITTALKATLQSAMQARGMKKTELARALGLDEKEVRRMMDANYPTKVPALERALSVLGKKVVLSVE
ncbi:MAG TPA: type II toxin-antitoxin system HicB family antitoxin [Wenzhouxiangella sp.]